MSRGEFSRRDVPRCMDGVVRWRRSDEDNEIRRREYMTNNGVRVTEQKSCLSGVGNQLRLGGIFRGVCIHGVK
jgi:hypothetical protein